MPEKLLLVDKPIGITSFDVIRRLRRKLNIRKMGHGGTLDPMASGLMLIGIEEGTKKLAEYLKLDKEYVTEVLVGIKTTTGDMEGEVIEEKAVQENFSSDQISKTLSEMTGVLTLPVSAYSAIKQGGVPFYKRARAAEAKGQTISESELPVRDMKVYEAELLNIEREDKNIVIKIRFKVGSGAYIRSLGEELGKRLGYPATLKSLRRTKIGSFDIKDAEIL